MVAIRAFTDDDAYTIFETMNDRGLSLSPLDMLKGYVLANITDEQKRTKAAKTWKDCVAALADMGKDEDADAFKAWLRSQYALTIRERKRHAQPMDFDRIGTEFHRWVKDNREAICLRSSADYLVFVQRDMVFYTQQYVRLREASQRLTPGLEAVYYNSRYEFTLQYPLLLAPLTPTDDARTIDRKLRVVAAFVDILLARRLWNFKIIAYSTMQYAMFTLVREIRRKSPPELASILRAHLNQEPATFASNDRLRVHQQNRHAIHQLLARMTDYVEVQSAEDPRTVRSHFEDYVAEGSNRYEVEHIWADHPERHVVEFQHPADFSEYRNRIGGLLLLPAIFNKSFGDLSYEGKLEHYYGQNTLAQSLNPKCYSKNAGFLRFIRNSDLPFAPHEHFMRADLDARQQLYQKLAEQIWSPERLAQEAVS